MRRTHRKRRQPRKRRTTRHKLRGGTDDGWIDSLTRRLRKMTAKRHQPHGATSGVYRWARKGRPADGLNKENPVVLPRGEYESLAQAAEKAGMSVRRTSSSGSSKRSSPKRSSLKQSSPKQKWSPDVATLEARQMSPDAFLADLGERTKEQLRRRDRRVEEEGARVWAAGPIRPSSGKAEPTMVSLSHIRPTGHMLSVRNRLDPSRIAAEAQSAAMQHRHQRSRQTRRRVLPSMKDLASRVALARRSYETTPAFPHNMTNTPVYRIR
jgi:hypothetical protein